MRGPFGHKRECRFVGCRTCWNFVSWPPSFHFIIVAWPWINLGNLCRKYIFIMGGEWDHSIVLCGSGFLNMNIFATEVVAFRAISICYCRFALHSLYVDFRWLLGGWIYQAKQIHQNWQKAIGLFLYSRSNKKHFSEFHTVVLQHLLLERSLLSWHVVPWPTNSSSIPRQLPTIYLAQPLWQLETGN